MNIATVETTDDYAGVATANAATAGFTPDNLFEGLSCCCATLVQTDAIDDAEPAPGRPVPYEVRVIRSANRRKTTSARLFGNVVEIRIPSWLSAEDEQQLVADYVERFEKKRRCWEIDLAARARDLAGSYDLPEPRSIRWSNRQRMRWGSCNQASAEILISHRLAEVPRWVLDYVIVHELAHLVVRGHPPAFHRLVARYPRAERAAGYLQAVGDLVE
jgi:hypothetical protein